MALPKLGILPPIDGGIKKWLVNEPYSAALDHEGNVATLTVASVDKLMQYISFDYERFALSSWESFYSSSLESKKFGLVSWPLLKNYYAAFFAAHAIMRATGGGVMRVERDQARTISQIITLQANSNYELKSGTYQYSLRENNSGTLSISLSPADGKVGVHDGFWKNFIQYLNEKADIAVQNDSVGSNEFVAAINDLTPALNGWFSARRNDINYQHAFGVWFPVIRSRSINDVVQNDRKSASTSYNLNMRSGNEIRSFLDVSRFLSCLNAELADHIAGRSSKSKSFGVKWRKFSNLHDA